VHKSSISPAVVGYNEAMKEIFKNIDKKNLLRFLAVFLLGAGLLIAIRFVIYKDTSVHYHANFAVFIDGKRLELDNFAFYEEVQSCGGNDVDNPRIRAHMHNQIDHVVHVHDDAVTWGHFFSNLGMTAGDTLFKTVDNTYVEGVDNVEIRYLLNGKEVQTIANRTIESEDVLLISIGNPTDEMIQKEFSQITQDAAEYNEGADPSTCTGSKELSLLDRLKIATGLFNE